MSRERQRANKRLKDRREKMEILKNFEKYGTLPVEKKKEEKLEKYDSFGKQDLTPYMAVNRIVRKERRSA